TTFPSPSQLPRGVTSSHSPWIFCRSALLSEAFGNGAGAKANDTVARPTTRRLDTATSLSLTRILPTDFYLGHAGRNLPSRDSSVNRLRGLRTKRESPSPSRPPLGPCHEGKRFRRASHLPAARRRLTGNALVSAPARFR